MSFDAASILKDADSSADPHSNIALGPMDSFSPTGGLFRASNLPLIQYIAFAYKLTYQQTDAVESQLPKWANTTHYDIVARAGGDPTKDQFRLMIQSLLSDRFKLALHYETKQIPALALVVAKPGKLGPGLREHKDDGIACTTASPGADPTAVPVTRDGFPVECGTVRSFPGTKWGVTRMGARAIRPAMMSNRFTAVYGADRPLVDETGLALVDFVIEFTPDRMTNTGLDYDPDTPPFVEALNKQLGLKLESRTVPVQQMVIDHIEEPSPN